jgi:hypothetical protein
MVVSRETKLVSDKLWKAIKEDRDTVRSRVMAKLNNKRDNKMNDLLYSFNQNKATLIFGTAYPKIKVGKSTFHNTIRALIKSRGSMLSKSDLFNLTVYYPDSYAGRPNDFALCFDTSATTVHYKFLENIEQWVNSLPTLRFYSKYIPRWDNAAMPKAENSFFINGIVDYSWYQWLIDNNVKPSQYKIFSKFNSDLSIAFKNGEHATMFKLAYGDVI